MEFRNSSFSHARLFVWIDNIRTLSEADVTPRCEGLRAEGNEAPVRNVVQVARFGVAAFCLERI